MSKRPQKFSSRFLKLDIKYPETLHIDFTDKCNHRCSFCIFHQNDKPGEEMTKYRDMSDETFFNVLPLVKYAKSIIIVGGGEPTLTKNFCERLETLKEFNPSVETTVTTNASRFSDPNFCKNSLKYIDNLNISVSGFKNRERLMLGSSNKIFKKALINISKFKKIYSKPSVNLNFIVMKETLDEIISAKVLAKKLSFDYVCFLDLWVTSDCMKNQSIRHDKKLMGIFLDNIKKAKGIGPTQYSIPLDIKEGKETIISSKFHYENVPCKCPWTTMKINTTGQVDICTLKNTPIGNINKSTIEDIWNFFEVDRYRKGMISHKYYKSCQSCPMTNKDYDFDISDETHIRNKSVGVDANF